MLGRSYKLCASGLFWFVVVYFCLTLLLGFREKCHSRGNFFSLQPWRIGLPSGESKIASFFLNTTIQFASHMGPKPMSVLEKAGVMYPVVGKSDANCGIGRVTFAADVETFTLDVPTLIVAALVSSGPCGAFGTM